MANLIQLIGVLVWPTVVVIVVIVFHKPLADFLRGIAWRVTKFSITQIISVELSLPEASHPRLGEFLPELQAFASGLIGAEESSDARASLYDLWGEVGDKNIEYMIVDLGTGQQWLTSRLFIFAVMLERMRGLRCLVFLGTRCNVPRSFLGTALPDEVRWSLARQYPWLEEAYIRAQVEQVTDVVKNENFQRPIRILSNQGALDPFEASTLVDNFLEYVQGKEKDKDHPPENRNEWEFIEKKQKSYWEHANWIDETRLESDLGNALHQSEDAWFKDTLDISQVGRVQALLRRKGSFVALINGERQFKSLIDRKSLLEQVAERAGKVSDDQSPAE